MTAEAAIAWVKLHKWPVKQRRFYCPECGGNLIVRAGKPPYFVHAKSTFDRPQPEFCKLRSGGRASKPPRKIIPSD